MYNDINEIVWYRWKCNGPVHVVWLLKQHISSTIDAIIILVHVVLFCYSVKRGLSRFMVMIVFFSSWILNITNFLTLFSHFLKDSDGAQPVFTDSLTPCNILWHEQCSGIVQFVQVSRFSETGECRWYVDVCCLLCTSCMWYWIHWLVELHSTLVQHYLQLWLSWFSLYQQSPSIGA